MPLNKSALAAAAALAVLALLAAGAQPIAERVMIHQLDQALAQAPVAKAEHGTIRYALWQGRLEIDGLKVETTLPGLRSFQAEHVEADGVSAGYLIGAGGANVRLAALRLEGLELAGDALSGSIEAVSLEAPRIEAGPVLADAVTLTGDVAARLSARRIAMTQAHLRTGTPPREIAFSTMQGEELRHGRFDKLACRELVALTPTESGTVRTEAASLDLAGFNYAAMLRPAPETLTDRPPLVERLAASGITVASATGKLSAEALSLAGLKAQAPSPATSQAAFSAAWLAGVSLGTLEMTTASLVPAVNPAARVTLGRVALTGLEPGKLDTLTLEQAAITGPEGVGRLASLALEGLSYGTAGKPFGLRRLRLGELAAGREAGEEVSVKEALFAIDPAETSIGLNTVTIPATALPWLLLAGYNELTIDYEARSHYDPAQAAIAATQRLSARDSGSFTLVMHLSNYPASFDPQQSFAAMMKFMELRLDTLELRYDDASLIDRLIKARAAATGRDVEAVREELLRTLTEQRQAFAAKPALQTSFDAVAAFLRKPGSLTFSLMPPEPIALGTLMTLSRTDPAAALDALGLSVR